MRTLSAYKRIRTVLRAGSITFGLSAVVLTIAPAFFNSLLGLSNNSALEWAMRMIGITLIALAGNMFSVASRGTDASVWFSGWVMCLSAFGLGVLTLLIPVELNWFTIAYSAVGFGFSGAYVWALSRK
jgi:hypothetical protein